MGTERQTDRDRVDQGQEPRENDKYRWRETEEQR